MSPFYGSRSIPAPDFTEGRSEETTLPRRNLIRQLDLTAEAEVEVDGGSGAGDVLADPMHRLPRNIRVMARGRPIHDVRGHSLSKIIRLLYDEEYAQTGPTTDAVGTEDVEGHFAIPFFLPGQESDFFALPTWDDDIVLVVDTADAEELFDADIDADSIDFNDGIYRLYEEPVEGVRKRPSTKWGAVSIRSIRREVNQDGEIDIELKHLHKGQHLRFILIEAMGGGSGGTHFAYEDGIVEEVQFTLNDQDLYEATPARVIQNRNKSLFGLSALETGVIALDMAENRRTRIGELPVVRSASDPTLRLDLATAAAGDTQVVVTTIAAVRGQLESNRRNRS